MARDLASDAAAGKQPRASAGSTVVFDFDGTLVSRDSMIDFSWRYCVRRPARFLLLGLVLPLALLVLLGSVRRAGGLLLWAMTVGSPTRQVVVAMREYGARILPRYAREAIFAELNEHLREGRRVVIATGSAPVLVRGLLAARGYERLPVVGSRFRRRGGGLFTEVHCVGRVKVQELARRHAIVEWSSVYSDSFADRSLMKRDRDVTLVWPSPRTLLRTQQLRGPEAALRVLRPD